MDVILIKEILSSILIIVGVGFMMIAAIGLLRLPDFYIRNSASTKASTLGLGLILFGISIHFNDVEIALEIIAILIFILLISPLSAHVMARSAFKIKIPFWEKTNFEDLEKQREKDKDVNTKPDTD